MCKSDYIDASERIKTFPPTPRARKLKVFYLSLMAIMLSTITAPATSSERKTYTTIGDPTCKVWTINREKADRGKNAKSTPEMVDRISDYYVTAWSIGYLNALNAKEEKKDVLEIVDAGTIHIWIDRYCSHNPNKYVSDAALELFMELRKIAK